MAEFLVKLHETVGAYISNAGDKKLARDIGNDVLQLSRAVVKHHTYPEERRYKYFLAQPSRMLAREMYRWNKSICRLLKRSPSLRTPWEIRIKRNLPLELFDTLKASVIACGWGQLTRSTSHVEEIVMTDEGNFRKMVLSWNNKYSRQLEEEELLVKREKDGGYSRVVLGKSRPVKMKYSKKLEVFSLSLRYGHWNSVPQHSFHLD